MTAKKAATKTAKRATRKRSPKQVAATEPAMTVPARGWSASVWGRVTAAWLGIPNWAGAVASSVLWFAAGMILVAVLSRSASPDPRPNPSPFAGLAEKVASISCDVDTRSHDDNASAMAEAITGVVGRINAGEFAQMAAAIAAARTAVTDALPPRNLEDWRGWSASLETILWAYHRDGALVAPDDAAKALSQVANGLAASEDCE